MEITCHSGDRLLVVAPHPDDESLACGGLIQRAVAAGADVRVVIATRGDANPWPQRLSERRWRLDAAAVARWGSLRTSEARAALGILGVAPDRVWFLEWADQGLTTRLVGQGEASIAQLREFIAQQRPTLVAMPDVRDSHPDHSAIALLVEAALRAESSRARVLTYWLHGRRGAVIPATRQVTLSARELAIKRAAALCHVSQTHFGRSRLLRFVDGVERFLEPGWPPHGMPAQWRWQFVARSWWSMAAARRVHVVAVSATGTLSAASLELRGPGRADMLRVTRISRLALDIELVPPWPDCAIVLAKLGTDHRINVFDSFAWTSRAGAIQETDDHAALPSESGDEAFRVDAVWKAASLRAQVRSPAARTNAGLVPCARLAAQVAAPEKGPGKASSLRLPRRLRSSENVRPWKILCDFDGTVSMTDATDVLLEHYAKPGWLELERQWREGAIGSRDCMSGQVELIEASEQEIDQLCDGIAIDPSFPRFVEQARCLELELVIVSDGLDRVIHRVLANNGLAGLTVIANRLVQAGPRGWAMQSPHASRACDARSGTCKCACATRSIAAGHKILLIGDGQSDVCVSARADLVFAKRRLLAHCQDAAIAHQPFDDFSEVVEMLPHLVQGMFDRDPLPPLFPGHRTEYA